MYRSIAVLMSALVSVPLPVYAGSGTRTDLFYAAVEPDVVYLKNGGLVRGELVIVSPDERVVIVDDTGERHEFAWDEVEEVKRGQGAEAESDDESSEASDEDESSGEGSEPESDAGAETEQGIVQLHIDVEGEGNVSLYEVTSQIVGTNVSGYTYRSACMSPCDKLIDGRNGQAFYVGGTGLTPSRAFVLNERRGDWTLRVQPRRRGRYLGGYFAVGLGASAAIGGGVGAGVIENDEGLRNGMIGLAVGGGLVMVLGIVLMVTGRTRVTWEQAK